MTVDPVQVTDGYTGEVYSRLVVDIRAGDDGVLPVLNNYLTNLSDYFHDFTK